MRLREGKKRQIRRMFESIGRDVLRLKRARFGSLGLGGLEEGACRPLNSKEIRGLKCVVGMSEERRNDAE
jgi:23S rRNA pseudouridine2605 synthase